MSKRKITGSKKNLPAAGLALLIVFFFTSCAEDEQPALRIPPGNSLYVASAIIAPPAETETEVNTRVAGDDVPVTVTAGSLGIFRSKGTGYTEALNNKKYTYTGADNGWQPATAGDTLFLNGDDAEVCAYYPHNADAAYQDATALPLYSGKYTGTGSLHDPNDLCYDIYRTVNSARRATTFEMKHALSLLEFRISKEAGYVGDCRITSIAVMNPDLLTESSIDITTGTYGTASTKGTITYNPGADADGILIESIAVTTGALLVPFTPTSEGLAIAFAVNGTPVEANIPTTNIAQLEAGHRYSVKVTMKAGSMEVTGVDMMPWDEVSVGGDDYTWYPVQEKENVIDIGLDFVIAPGNLIAKAKGNGYTYAFAKEQGYYSGIDQAEYNSAGGDYFCWNELSPDVTDAKYQSWDNARDPCRKVADGSWYTPSKDQLQALADLYTNNQAKWGTYTMKSVATPVSGIYFGTADVPDEANQDKYVFLPVAGYRYGTICHFVGSMGNYWSSMLLGSEDAYCLYFESDNCYVDAYYVVQSFSVRCVKDKPQPEPIDIGLDFLIAPGNLKATKQADNTYKYTFAFEQGFYSGDGSGGDYFRWNTLDPTATASTNTTDAWDTDNDPCRKIEGGSWYTPTKEQLQALIDAGSVWGENIYTMGNDTKVNGRYFGISLKAPSKAKQDEYVFLPAAGYQNVDIGNNMDKGTYGDYWSATPEPITNPSAPNAYNLDFSQNDATTSIHNFSRHQGLPVRCVKDKQKPIDIGLNFVIAPGNLIGIKQADNTYKYDFADEQGYFSGDVTKGDYFARATLEPGKNYDHPEGDLFWDDIFDPCRQVGDGTWRTPTSAQWDEMAAKGTVWGSYTKKDGTPVSGRYIGTMSLSAAQAAPDSHVFLPAAGYCPMGGSLNYDYHYYQDQNRYLTFNQNFFSPEGDAYMSQLAPIRCVKAK